MKLATGRKARTPALAAPVAGRRHAQAQRPQRAVRIVARATLEQQDKQMREAEARWDAQLRDGIVKNVMSRDVASLMDQGWTVLDVRPYTETRKVHVKDSIEVPLFQPDTSLDPSSLLKQMSAFGMGGWWLGGTHMVPNDKFLAEVQSKVPKDAKVIVACQKGLRSLAACEQLSRAGYKEVAWINGGFDNSKPGEIPTRDGADVRLAGIGGLSAVLGWTEVQQETAGPMGGYKSVLLFAAIVVALDIAVFAYEQVQYMKGQTPFQ